MRQHFNPRHPYGWRPNAVIKLAVQDYNFNPRHPYGWRHFCRRWRRSHAQFQSTPPIRVATVTGVDDVGSLMVFQSTPPIRVATRTDSAGSIPLLYFNPRHPYGWRRFTFFGGKKLISISIHATHTGGDQWCQNRFHTHTQFQSTPPIRVATKRKSCNPTAFRFQSTPPIRVATKVSKDTTTGTTISIHATHTGGDACALT